MGYVESQIVGDENIRFQAKVHWVIYVGPASWLVTGLGMVIMSALVLGSNPKSIVGAVAGLAFFASFIPILIGISDLVGALVRRRTTELVITSKRIIAKFGFIRRHTFELQLAKVEGVNLHQTMTGRLLGYGTVRVHAAANPAPIPFISQPDAFKRALADVVN